VTFDPALNRLEISTKFPISQTVMVNISTRRIVAAGGDATADR